MTWAAIAVAVLALSLIGFTGATPSRGVPAIGQDDQLAKTVWNGLRGDPALSGNDTLKVNVKNAVVKVEGVVERSPQKEAAEKAVASVPGVATVIYLIEVHSNAPAGSLSE
jgi:osmotically-inducible protein OsmY